VLVRAQALQRFCGLECAFDPSSTVGTSSRSISH
jgi:hypothetical protein